MQGLLNDWLWLRRARLVLLSVLLLALVACGGASSEYDESGAYDASGAPPGMEDGAEEEMPMEAPAAEPEAMGGADADASGEAAPNQQGVTRRIIYNGSLQLRVDDPRAVAQTMGALAQRHGGYVSNANIYEVGDDSYRASVQLRVDAGQFDEAMSELRTLGSEVLSENIGTRDVTDQYVDLEARIENLERTETELQILLTEAREDGSTEDVLTVYRELTSIREQIEQLQGQLNVLADQVSLATISVELVPPEAQVELVNEGWSLTRTIRQAARSLTEGLQVLADLIIYFLIAILPNLLLLGIFLYILFRFFTWIYRRLNRDSARVDRPVDSEPPVVE